MALDRALLTCGVAACLLLAAGCGKPEDARGYSLSSSDTAAAAKTAEVKTPPPPVPAWASPMMGQPLRQVSKGTAVCKGALDTVVRRHTGPQPGAEMQGWGWDEQGAKPLDRILFTNANGKIVGAGTVGDPRPDVPAAMPEVKTPKAGWHGVADVATDQVQAVGVTTAGDTCVLGQTILG